MGNAPVSGGQLSPGTSPWGPRSWAELTIAILKPIPGSPSRLFLGMRQSSKMRLAVDEARIPSLSSFFPSVSPGVGMGTRKALMPCKGRQTDSMTSPDAVLGHAPYTNHTRHKLQSLPSASLKTSGPDTRCWPLWGRCRLQPQANSSLGRKSKSPEVPQSRHGSIRPQGFRFRNYEMTAVQRSHWPSLWGPYLMFQGFVSGGKDHSG